MAIGRAKSMGIREAFYMTFSYIEIRLCLAIGKPVLIVTGYCVQARVRRSSQDGRRRTVGTRRSAQDGRQPASMLKHWRPAASARQPAPGVNRSGMAVSARQPGMAVKHHSFLICFARRPISADRPPFSEVPTHFRKVIHRRKSRVVPSGCG